MARKKRRSARRHSSKKGLSAMGARRGRRRRRRMGAGAGAFKLLSNPLIGGAAGALAGLLLNKVLKKVNLPAPVALIAPVAGAFVAAKRVPFVAAGITAGFAGAFLVSKFPQLSDDAHFVNDNLLNSGSPLVLDAPGDEIPYSLHDALLNDYGMVRNASPQFQDLDEMDDYGNE